MRAAPLSGTWPTYRHGCTPRLYVRLERSLVELAQVSRQINLARETQQAPPLPADIVAMLNQVLENYVLLLISHRGHDQNVVGLSFLPI